MVGVIMDTDALIAVNGQITRPDEARISVLDRGFLIGDAVFEVCVAFGRQVLDINRHLSRLRASAEMLDLCIPWSDEELAFELTSLAEQVPHPKKYLRLTVTGGPGLGVRMPENRQPSRVTYCFKAEEDPLKAGHGTALKRVVRAGSVRGAQPKTPYYLPAAMALSRAERDGFGDILWSHSDGEVAEAHAANIFFMTRDGDQVTYITPPAHSGILLGVTRDTLISLLRNAGIPVREEVVYADELPRFDEAFLTSSVRGLVPVSRIDGHKLHTLRPQSTFWHIERLFLTWVATQVGFRVDWRTGKILDP